MSNSTDNNSYRPSMKGYQITNLITICKQDASAEAMDLLRVFSPFAAKIEYGAKIAGYIPTIGAGKPKMDSMDSIVGTPAVKIDWNAVRKAAYDKWILDANSCNMVELERAMIYKADLQEPPALLLLHNHNHNHNHNHDTEDEENNSQNVWAELNAQMAQLDARTAEQIEADLQEQKKLLSGGIT